MTLKEKFAPMVYCYLGSGMLTNTYDENVVDHFAKKCEDVSDEFASGFLDWVMIKMSNPNFISHSNKELLRIYKEEKNL